MGQVDEAHDAEDEGQAGREQEQHDAQLKRAKRLFEQQCERHEAGSG